MIQGLVVRLDPEVSAERMREIVDAIVAIDGTGPIYVWNPLYERMDTPAQDVRRYGPPGKISAAPDASSARTGE